MSSNDSIKKTIKVALLLCIVCSVVVSTAAVLLKPAQDANKSRDFKRSILEAAGMLEPGKSIEEQFQQVQTRIVDLDTGKFADEQLSEDYDQWRAAKDPKRSVSLSPEKDIAKIGRREKYATVYLADDGQGGEIIILPVRGYGLWSTLFGFLAVESDVDTVVGLGFYEHAETPGLGGEVDNPRWKRLWAGKELFDESGQVAIQVVKGSVDLDSPKAKYQVDGLSGATLTSRGVHQLIRFWLGEDGFGPFLENLRQGEA